MKQCPQRESVIASVPGRLHHLRCTRCPRQNIAQTETFFQIIQEGMAQAFGFEKRLLSSKNHNSKGTVFIDIRGEHGALEWILWDHTDLGWT